MVIDKVLGVEGASLDVPIEQIPYAKVPVPYADQLINPQPSRGLIHPDDAPPVLANLNAMPSSGALQAEELHSTNHALNVNMVGGGGGGGFGSASPHMQMALSDHDMSDQNVHSWGYLPTITQFYGLTFGAYSDTTTTLKLIFRSMPSGQNALNFFRAIQAGTAENFAWFPPWSFDASVNKPGGDGPLEYFFFLEAGAGKGYLNVWWM